MKHSTLSKHPRRATCLFAVRSSVSLLTLKIFFWSSSFVNSRAFIWLSRPVMACWCVPWISSILASSSRCTISFKILPFAAYKHLNVVKAKLLRFAAAIRSIQHRRHLHYNFGPRRGYFWSVGRCRPTFLCQHWAGILAFCSKLSQQCIKDFTIMV